MPVIGLTTQVGPEMYLIAREEANKRGLRHLRGDHWPAHGQEPGELNMTPLASDISHWEGDYLVEVAQGIAKVVIERPGTVRATAFGESPEAAAAIIAELRELIPPRDNPDESRIPVTFWTYGPNGAQSVIRDLDAPAWQDIVPNYAASTLQDLGKLFAPDVTPGHGGQFVLWHGDPGTGKTTALRALAREWRDWCRFHYIADPDQFFGQHADYMLGVMIREEDTDQPVSRGDSREPWRVLILEDTAELLYADAKREVGQALSRFLNCVDGMIGQGLRVLVLVTTNEPLGKLHPAVTRPGRGALTVEFEPLSSAEAGEWLAAHGHDDAGADKPRILADLYAQVEGFEQRAPVAHVGF